jgi:hypothetical protein
MKTNANKMTLSALAVVAASGLAGCAADESAASPEGTTASELSTPGLQENIARLNALHVIDVRALQTSVIVEGSFCYRVVQTSIGRACPEDLEALAEKIAIGDRRLNAFVVAAEAAAAATGPAGHGPAEVAADITALNSLKLVDVKSFLVDQPEDGNCYQRFCAPSNIKRAGELHRIVEAAERLK